MKLRSIVTAGLLGTGLLMMSGCDWLDDEVEDILKVNSSAVYAVNDLGSDIQVTVHGDTQTVTSEGIAQVFPTVSQDGSLKVSYDDGASTDLGTVSLNNSGIHVYAATNCDLTKDHLVDTYDGMKIRVMNLTEAPIAKEDLVLVHNGTAVDLPKDAAECAVTTAFPGDTTGIWSVTVNGTKYNDINLTKNIGFEIVVYTIAPNNYTIVPLLGFDDLL